MLQTDEHRPRRLLSLAETSERLSVSVSTVRRLVSSGLLPAVRVGHQLRVDPDELERYVYADPPSSARTRA